MQEIPNIVFKSQDGSNDIEFLPLKELFTRIVDSPDHNPKRPHRLHFFALLIITQGNGTHQVDLKSYPLKKGSVVKIAKGQVHAFQEDLEYDGFLVVFTEDYLLKHFSSTSIEVISHLYNYHLSSPLVVDDQYGQLFLEEVRQEEKAKDTYIQKEIIAKMLELYLLRLEQQSHSPKLLTLNSEHLSIFNRFKSLVEQDCATTRNVKDYAAQLQISTKHLNHIVREITLNTAKVFIDQYVVLEAKRALLSEAIRIKEVAYKLGFNEVTNFTKFFKKLTGLSPKDFRLKD